MKRLVCAMLFAGLLALPAAVSLGAEDAKVDLKIVRVALFKNGLGYFDSTAELPEDATTVEFGRLPVPSHGTFWVGYPEEVKVRGLFTRMAEVETGERAQSLRDMLAANVGRKVTVFGAGDPVGGTILAVIKPSQAEAPSPYVMSALPAPGRRPNRALLLLKTETGVVTLNADSLSRVDIVGSDISSSAGSTEKRPELRIELERPAGGKPVSVSYLARGITWAPSYFIDISDGKTARLTAKALVVNEVADLEGVRLELITGFPNIQFAEISSPVAMAQKLEGFMNALVRGRSEERRRSVVMQQRAVMSNAAWFEAAPGRPTPSYSTAAPGAAAEDLFFYPVEDVTLRREETAYLPLFTVEASYYHVYTWKVPDYLDENERYRRERESEDRSSGQEVWHACRLTNGGKTPWTTAPAQFVKDGRFVGQDICYYTASGAETTVRINQAVNLAADEAEFEVERERNASRLYGYSYDLVTVNGELKLRSRLDKTVRVEVTKELSGEVIEASDEARDVPTAKGLRRANPRHKLVWNIEMEPGEERTLKYVYKVYVRN